MRDYKLSLNLITNNNVDSKKFKQFDTGNEIELEVYQNENLREDEKLILTNESVLAFFRRKDGQVLQKNCTIRNGNIIAKTEKDVLGVPGTLELECLIKKGSIETTTQRIIFNVDESIARSGAIEEDPRYTADLVTELLEVRDNVKAETLGKIDGLSSQLAEKASITARRTPLLYGHRAFEYNFPECTIGAIQSAIAMGAKAVEVDLRQTLDKVIVVIHDDTLDRTTNGTGKVAEKTWDEIRNLDCGSWYSSDFEGERIPTLDTLFENCNQLEEIILQIGAVDDTGLVRLVEKIKQYNMLDKALIYTAERYTQRNVFLKLGEIDSKIRRAHGIDLTNLENRTWIKQQKGEIYLLQNFDEWTANYSYIGEMVDAGLGIICSSCNMEKSAQVLLPYGINRFLAQQMWGVN